jgi:hypothetical protein
MVCHTDEDIVNNVKAQNKTLFEDLKADEKTMRGRYRKRNLERATMPPDARGVANPPQAYA